MKKKKIALIVVIVLLVAGGAFFIFGKNLLKKPSSTNEQNVTADVQNVTADVQNAPDSSVEVQNQTSSDQAGVEVTTEGAEAPTVQIPADKQQLIGVRTTEAAVRPLLKVTRTVGRVAYDETKLSTVNTKFEGWIEKLYVDYTGKYVRKGQPLASLYSPELVATEQEYLNALRWAHPAGEKGGIKGMLSKDAQSLVDGARQRLRYFDITDAQIKSIEKSGKPFRTLTIYSPVSGYVVNKAALQGMRVMPGDKLFDLADLSTVWVLADVYESDLPFVKVGDTARISLDNIPGREFVSRIDYVYPALSAETRTAQVRFSIPNPGGRLKPEMFTNIQIKTPLGRELAIPESAVINTGLRQIVYVDRGDGNFEPREITTGEQAGGMVQVLSGLKAGERVASAGNFLIDSEARLEGVVK